MIFFWNTSDFIYPFKTIYIFTALFLLFTIALLAIISRKLKHHRKKILTVWIAAWTMFCILMFNLGIFGIFEDIEAIDKKTYTKQELLTDIGQLEGYIMHKNPLYFADQDELQKLFDNAYQRIEDGMTEFEFYRLVNPIVAAVNCGHTNLSISEELLLNRKQTAKFFPLKITLIGNRLYVLEGDSAAGIQAGDEIKFINGRSSQEIISMLLKNISGDGSYETKRRYIISRHFNSRFYDFIDSSDNFQVVLVNKDGHLKNVRLRAIFREEFNTDAWNLHFADYQNKDYYHGRLYEDYAILTIRFFANEKDNKFKPFLHEFFNQLKKRNINKLVIDLRGNYGGDSFMAKELLSYLSEKELVYFDGDLPFLYRLLGFKKNVVPKESLFNKDVAVLTDGACFSTTAHLCSLIQYHNLGILIGSESGGSYVCTDSSRDIVLKNTHLRLHYSTLTFKVKIEDMSENRGVNPDISISPAIEELLNNKDAVMDAALMVLFHKNIK